MYIQSLSSCHSAPDTPVVRAGRARAVCVITMVPSKAARDSAFKFFSAELGTAVIAALSAGCPSQPQAGTGELTASESG